MRKLAVLGAVLAFGSCKRGPPPPPPAVVVAAAASAPSASASATADVDPDAALKEIAKEWNDAINARDMAALAALHGSNVRFYGQPVDNATYCAKMKAALAKDPSFHQTLAAIRVDWPQQTKAKVSFRKKDDKAEHAAYLVMEKSDQSWKIVEESDLVTDANLKCVNSADSTTLAGKIDEGSFIWHEHVTPTRVLVLDAPICVIRSGTDYWGDNPSDARMDGVDSVTLADDKSKFPAGTRVSARVSHFQPHDGSGHYSTSLLVFVDSINAK